VVLKEEVLRLVDIPLIIKLPGMPPAPRGASVKLDLVRWDEVDLTVEARLHEIVAAPVVEVEEELEEELPTQETDQSSEQANSELPGADVEIATTGDEAGTSVLPD
jgi:exoribonuclease-2